MSALLTPLCPEAPEAAPSGSPRPTVLVVEDTPDHLRLLGELLAPLYRVRVASSGEQALASLRSGPPVDLVLLDIMMPGMDGYQVLQQIRQDAALRELPVIFVTAVDGDTDEEYGLRLGAVDYVAKPVRPALLLARVNAQLQLKQARDALTERNRTLDREVQRRMSENELVKDVTLNALAMLAETRDNETGNHLLRTQAYVAALVGRLRTHPRFRDALAGPRGEYIAKASPLHDIGKVGIPDHILLKPGKLTAEEFEVIKRHPTIGGAALGQAIERVLGQRGPVPHDFNFGGETSALAFLEVARQIAQSHHEKWDGSGYPQGLRGDEIPVAARLMALADVFDALSCKRHYKPPYPMEQVQALIIAGRGSHFDPDVVDAFLALREEFADIAVRFADAADDAAPGNAPPSAA